MDNDNYNDYYYGQDEENKKKLPLPLRILRWVCLAFLIFIIIFVLMRININNHAPAEAEKIVFSNESFEYYSKDPDRTSGIYDYEIFSYYLEFSTLSSEEQANLSTEKLNRIVRNDMSPIEHFKVSKIIYMSDTKELQFTIRYNESSAERYKKSDEGEIFVFALRDEQANRYTDYEYKAFDQSFLGKKLYNYRRVVFKNVSLEDLRNLTIYFYDASVPVTETNQIDSIMIYDSHLGMMKGEYAVPSAADKMTKRPFVIGFDDTEKKEDEN